MIRILALLISCFVSFGSKGQTNSTPHYDVVAKAKSLIRENYIIGDKVKDILEFLDPEKYESLDREDFVSRCNADLFQITGDKHLRIEYNPTYSEKINSAENPNEQQRLDERKTNYGFERLEILHNNIGYIKLTYFADPSELSPLVKSVFLFVQHTDVLIIDLRGNSGGSGGMVQLIAGGLLDKAHESILKISYKEKEIQLKTDDSPVFSYDKPIYLLCDHDTFSAGEAFAFILKNRKRAVVVGELTAGAGNIAGPYRIDNDFVITIPVGVIVDPLTNQGWEQVGVIPDVQVKSEDALASALQSIGTR
jgi:C-terminal processing protease CtpA/Prc